MLPNMPVVPALVGAPPPNSGFIGFCPNSPVEGCCCCCCPAGCPKRFVVAGCCCCCCCGWPNAPPPKIDVPWAGCCCCCCVFCPKVDPKSAPPVVPVFWFCAGGCPNPPNVVLAAGCCCWFCWGFPKSVPVGWGVLAPNKGFAAAPPNKGLRAMCLSARTVTK